MATFTPFVPCDILKPFVSSFAISESAEENTYTILPGTGLVIGFQYKGQLHIIEKDPKRLETSGITGLHDSFRVFRNSPDTGSVLVYFKEGGAAPFFNQPLHELFRESVSLENFMLRSELLVLEEQLQEAKTDASRISVVENFLIARMKDVKPDKLIATALALIHKSKGTIRISELAYQLNISQSPLEKRFRQIVGTSPKKFATVVRLKHTLSQHSNEQSLTSLSYESGYYDQAHFIKEFKSFTGETPATFFSRK